MRKHFKTVDEINLELLKMNDELENIAEELKTKNTFEEREKPYMIKSIASQRKP